MDNHRIVRAWKDELYRQSLSTEEQALLPANPIGEIELTETELLSICGGIGEYHSHRCNGHHNRHHNGYDDNEYYDNGYYNGN